MIMLLASFGWPFVTFRFAWASRSSDLNTFFEHSTQTVRLSMAPLWLGVKYSTGQNYFKACRNVLPSTTLYYKACRNVLPSTTLYYKACGNILPSTTLYYKACRNVLSSTTLYYKACRNALLCATTLAGNGNTGSPNTAPATKNDNLKHPGISMRWPVPMRFTIC